MKYLNKIFTVKNEVNKPTNSKIWTIRILHSEAIRISGEKKVPEQALWIIEQKEEIDRT